MALAWIVLNIIDLALTSQALGAGATEGNPVLNLLLGYDFWAFAVGKMAVVLAVVAIYQALKRHKKIAYVFSGGNLLISLIVLYELIMLI